MKPPPLIVTAVYAVLFLTALVFGFALGLSVLQLSLIFGAGLFVFSLWERITVAEGLWVVFFSGCLFGVAFVFSDLSWSKVFVLLTQAANNSSILGRRVVALACALGAFGALSVITAIIRGNWK